MPTMGILSNIERENVWFMTFVPDDKFESAPSPPPGLPMQPEKSSGRGCPEKKMPLHTCSLNWNYNIGIFLPISVVPVPLTLRQSTNRLNSAGFPFYLLSQTIRWCAPQNWHATGWTRHPAAPPVRKFPCFWAIQTLCFLQRCLPVCFFLTKVQKTPLSYTSGIR